MLAAMAALSLAACDQAKPKPKDAAPLASASDATSPSSSDPPAAAEPAPEPDDGYRWHTAEPGKPYPPILIATSRRDDRVHPGHARKFAARLGDQGHDHLYFEDTAGGHSNDADPVANARRWARHYVYLAQQLMD